MRHPAQLPRASAFMLRCARATTGVVLVLSTACGAGAPTAPGLPVGTFALLSIGGQPLPLPKAGGGSVSDGSVIMRADRQVTLSETTSTPSQGGQPGTSIIAFGTYTLQGDAGRFALAPQPGTAAGDLPPDSLFIEDTRIVVRHAVISGLSGERVYGR